MSGGGFGIVTAAKACHRKDVSTLAEIQHAIEQLPPKEKKALSAWFVSQTEQPMPHEEEAALLASLDRAAKQLDAGKGMTADAVRGLVRQWASK